MPTVQINPGGAATLAEAIGLQIDALVGDASWRQGIKSAVFDAPTGVLTFTLTDDSTVATPGLVTSEPSGAAGRAVGSLIVASTAEYADAVAQNPNAYILEVNSYA